MRDRFSVDRSIFRFFRSSFQKKRTPNGLRSRKLTFDALEERTLLTAVLGSDVAAESESVLAAEVSDVDRFDVELEVLESGAARYTTQTGVRYSTSTTYCAVNRANSSSLSPRRKSPVDSK